MQIRRKHSKKCTLQITVTSILLLYIRVFCKYAPIELFKRISQPFFLKKITHQHFFRSDARDNHLTPTLFTYKRLKYSTLAADTAISPSQRINLFSFRIYEHLSYSCNRILATFARILCCGRWYCLQEALSIMDTAVDAEWLNWKRIRQRINSAIQ